MIKQHIAILTVCALLTTLLFVLSGCDGSNPSSTDSFNQPGIDSSNPSGANVSDSSVKSVQDIDVRPQYQGISASYNNSMAVNSSGELFIWGSNSGGRLTNGTLVNGSFVAGNNSIRTPSIIMEDIIAVSSGGVHNVAISTDGSLWGWGLSYAIGRETRNIVYSKPVKIMDNIIAVSAGSIYTMAITYDNTLWAIGDNICTGIIRGEATPVKVMDNVISVSSGSNHVMAITEDGVLWAWGSNESGQLGDGSTENRADPVRIMDNVVRVSAGNVHTAAITADGALWTWGNNESGQLGNGEYGIGIYLKKPMKIMDNVVQVSAGGNHTVVVTADGGLWDLGVDDSFLPDQQATPIRIMDSIAYAVTGGHHTLAVTNNGDLWAFGQNGAYGLLGNNKGGDGTGFDYESPVKILPDIMLSDTFSHGNNSSSPSNESSSSSQTDKDEDNSSSSAPSFDDACESLTNYYKGFLQAINQQDMSYLRNATPEQEEYLEERVFVANKDYIFTFQQIIIDLDTINFFEYEGTQCAEFYAAFQFSNEPRSGSGNKEHGANVQLIGMIYDEDLQNWAVAFSEIQSDVTIGSNQRVLK